MDPPDQDKVRTLLRSVFTAALELELDHIDRLVERKLAPDEPSSVRTPPQSL